MSEIKDDKMSLPDGSDQLQSHVEGVQGRQEKLRTSGIDSVSISMFEANLDENLDALENRFKKATYEPLPNLRVYIAKSQKTQSELSSSRSKHSLVRLTNL